VLSAPLRPPRLAAGARVALVAPAGPIQDARLAAALRQCESLGLEPVVARSALRRHGYLAGRDEERAADLQQALADPGIDAVWALRGGYGTMRLLSALDFSPLRTRPKAFIGFSDNTAIHLALLRAGLVSFHGPHAGGAFPPFTEHCFRSVLFEAAPAGVQPLPEPATRLETVAGGVAEGALVGGNLALLAATCGTPFGLQARGRILFLEEVGEATYRIDRTLMQLRLSGALDGLAGLIVGQFTEGVDHPELPLGRLIEESAATLGVPCVAGAPIGHVDDNWCLPVGVRARLDADAGTVEILEPSVT
jgi:muramoyltetrapeptide carboxypeptidase